MTSSRVALTAAFLALAAGGTAACDTGGDEYDTYDTTTYAESDDIGGATDPGAAPVVAGDTEESTAVEESTDAEESGDPAEAADLEESTDEVFYCADQLGEIVDEDLCATDDVDTPYLLWHSPAYPRGLPNGTFLDGGDSLPPGDRDARRAFRLPPTGKVTNGTVKTNVVGRGSAGSGSVGGDSAGG